VLEDVEDIEIKPDEIEVDLFRSSGPGGQNVNKRETAVRIHHKPTGLWVSCQTERSQSTNRERAFKLLKLRLADLRRREQEVEAAKAHGEVVRAEWGGRCATTCCTRTARQGPAHGVEVTDPDKVLDGDLDVFVNAMLRGQKASEENS